VPKAKLSRPNVYEVAERAGVSIATVSRVLRGSAPVADAIVEQAHGAVGIVFPDLAGPYYSRVIGGFEHEAVERKSAALILATHGRDNADELVADLADRVDGLVIMGRTVSDEFVASLERPTVPVVLLARPPVGAIPAVRSGSSASAEALAAHLVQHGRRRIVYVGDPELSPDVSARWRGVRRALRQVGLVPSRVPCGGFDVEHGYKAGLQVFAAGNAHDAVMCANDEVASGVYRSAGTCGVRVPEDVAVTGWDDTAVAARLHPALTTVRQPMRELGARAAKVLFARIDGRPAASAVLRTSVVIRESCGCRGRSGRNE
jgi:LacI family transcriptional regulator